MNTNVWWDQQHLKAVVNHVFDNWPWKNILYGQAKSQRLRKIVYGIWMDSKKSCAKVFFFTLRKVAPRFYLNVFGVLRNSKGSPEASTEGSGRDFWVKKKACPQVWWSWSLGRYDFGLFWNFITGKQGLLCVTETWRYGYKRDYGDRVETPHGTTIGCEKSSNGLKKRIFLLLSTLLR